MCIICIIIVVVVVYLCHDKLPLYHKKVSFLYINKQTFS